MKRETRSFYEAAVVRTVLHISRTLDAALDLGGLARGAALSPFHFHRVFRGMLGETPLAMHRRLRLERAADQLLIGDTPVTTLAFDAGYETHEAFTRAFRQAYGTPPSAFRQAAADAAAACARPAPFQLAAPSGVHFRDPIPDEDTITFIAGGAIMNVTIENLSPMRVATVHHIGPYSRISEAFQRLGDVAGPAGLLGSPDATMLGIYYDDPETTAAAELQSDAGVAVPEGVTLPRGLAEKRLPAGRYAHFTHVGPYSQLGDVWARLMGEWLPRSGQRVGEGSGFEVYRNTPATAPPEELRTDLYLPLA